MMKILEPNSPLRFMTLVEGDTYIPISVTAVVAFGFVSSSLFINAKPWAFSPEGAWDVPAESVSQSSLGGRVLLLLFRLCSFVHLSFILLEMFSSRGLLILYFYTNWTFVMETLYFLAAFAASALSLWRKSSGRVGWLGISVITLFHMSLAATLIVDLLHWGLLWPIQSRSPDPAVREHFRKVTFSWVSYNTHILNFVLMFVELLLNKIPLHIYLFGFGGLFSSCFGLWAFSVYTRTSRWIYPFLNASKPWAPYMYVAIYVGHWLIYGLTISLFHLRDKLLGTRLAVPEEQEAPKKTS